MSFLGLVAFCGIVFVASVIQGISGFAFGMVVLMVFPYLFGYTKSLVLASLMAAVLVCYNAYLYRKSINWQWVPWWVGVFLVTDLLSVMVLKQVGDNPIWYKLMGVIFILMALYLLWGQKVLHVKANKKSLLLLGGGSGLIMGAFGVGGPLMAAFFLEATPKKRGISGHNSDYLCDHASAGHRFARTQWYVYRRSYWLYVYRCSVHGGRAVDSTPSRAPYGRTDNAPLYLPGGDGRWRSDAVPLMIA